MRLLSFIIKHDGRKKASNPRIKTTGELYHDSLMRVSTSNPYPESKNYYAVIQQE